MINSTVNFTTPESSTTYSFGLLDIMEMYACSFSFLFGLPTNFYVLWLIITGTESGVASMFFQLSLSVCEIGISVNGLFFILSFWFSSLTTLVLFLIGLGVTGRPLFQCLISIERYLAVVHPVTFLKYKPLRYRVICSATVWIITLGSCFSSMFLPLSTIGQTWFLSVQFLFFFSIQLFCLVAVLRALKQSGPGERGRERKEENHMKRRAFYLILITTVNMVIIYVPYIITGLFTIVTKQNIRALWSICLLCFLLPGFVQPLLFLYHAEKLSCLCSSKVM
ncbi:uracil nucleotide/cysteinyl leukotriene receptor-like [Megalobrama amblycephala]|uniref:uracil nucleotide/cysteinyl leukotriene receptor-like n=1 Tax=Megalobrama amblycephala TaxID=75352 RepID=UPI00201418AB|nr:uracil nucleotide/cysteinyl leukotriene receptor-like [Megalobrama amblycephala]